MVRKSQEKLIKMTKVRKSQVKIGVFEKSQVKMEVFENSQKNFFFNIRFFLFEYTKYLIFKSLQLVKNLIENSFKSD